MSGSIGANRIPRDAVETTLKTYINKVLKNFPGFKSAKISGSYNTSIKPDHGDIDLVINIEGDEQDRKKLKQNFSSYISSLPDDITIPFSSGRYVGKKAAGTGDIVIVQFPIEGYPDLNVQIDNMIVASEQESDYRKSFLDLPAEKQGLLVGLAKAILLEEDPIGIFKRLGITNIPQLDKNQEFEFNLSNKGLTLRLVTLGDNFKELSRNEIWTTFNWSNVLKLFQNYKLDGTWEELLSDINSKIKNPRSKNRIKGVFKSLVVINSGEYGTPKGDNKLKAISIVDKLLENMLFKGLVKELISPLLENEIKETIALYPGKFKPPHKGHFEVAKQLLDKADKVEILISPVPVEGINADQSKAVWELYNKLLDNKLDIKITPESPIKYVFDIIANNQQNYYITVYGKGEQGRFKKIGTDPRYLNAEMFDGGILENEEGVINATNLRAALAYSKDISKFLPQGITPEQYETALGMDEEVPLSEITINRPPRTWDFTKYIPDFDPNNIKIGDTITTGIATIKVEIIDETHDYDSSLWFSSKNSFGFTSTQLEKINNKNNLKTSPYYKKSKSKEIDEIQVVNPSITFDKLDKYIDKIRDIVLKDKPKYFDEWRDFWSNHITSGINLEDYIIKNPEELIKTWNNLQKFVKDNNIKILNEITVNNPSPTFPLYIKNREEFNKYKPFLKSKGKFIPSILDTHSDYIGEHGITIFSMNPISGFNWSLGKHINEITVNNPNKLKAFKNRSGAIYLVFNNEDPTIYRNSSLKNYKMSVGWIYNKSNKVKFDEADHTVEEFKSDLKRLNIPFTYESDDKLLIGIDKDKFVLKLSPSYDLHDEDIKDWYNKIPVNEIQVNKPNHFPKNENWTYVVKDKDKLLKVYDLLKKQGWDSLSFREEDSFTDEAYPIFIFNNTDGQTNSLSITFMFHKNGKILNPEELPKGYIDEIKINNPIITPEEVMKFINDNFWKLFGGNSREELASFSASGYVDFLKKYGYKGVGNSVEALLKDKNTNLPKLYSDLKNLLNKNTLEENKQPNHLPTTLKELIASLTKYMIDQRMNIKPLPKLILINNDSNNSNNILGKTAYYNPNDCSITLYTLNRHPKDIGRSYSHEMIHRIQDNEGRLKGINTTNTNEGGNLEELEKEAYLKGNMTFRNWEDNLKNNINEWASKIDKHNFPQFLHNKINKTLCEITLNIDNAVEINGNLTEGYFTVGKFKYIYSIKNLKNPYDDGKFYNIYFHPEGQKINEPIGTSTGKDYIKILSTMYKIIIDFVNKEKPEYIGISSMDNDGSKNYHFIYNNLTKNNNIPGYFKKNSNLDFEIPEGKGHFIVLKKKENN
jgi:hypothetical protein